MTELKNPENLVAIGKIRKLRGTEGYFTVKSFCTKLNSIPSRTKLFIESNDDDFEGIELEECSFYGDKIVLKFKDYDNLNEASKLIGRIVYLERHNFPELPIDEYYWFDIMDMDVYSKKDEFLGTIKDIFSTGSNDVFVLENKDSEIMIPATKEVIKKIDYEKKRISVELIEGLID
jgi:16S rRNA processing protein RimM